MTIHLQTHSLESQYFFFYIDFALLWSGPVQLLFRWNGNLLILPLMILWFITWIIYLVCVPVSDTEVLKPLEFPVIRMIKVFCYANEQFWKAPEGQGLLASGTNHMIGGLVSPTPPPQGEKLEVGQGFNQSWSCDEASIKSKRLGFGEFPCWWRWGGWWVVLSVQRAWKLHTLSTSLRLFHLAVSELHLFVTDLQASK